MSILRRFEQPSDDAILRVKPTTKLEVSPDGMSGGPGFTIQNTTDGLRAYFAGIVVRGGLKDIFVLKSGAPKAFLDSILPWSTKTRPSSRTERMTGRNEI